MWRFLLMRKLSKVFIWRTIILLSIPVQYAILQILKANPSWVQEHYTEGFYNGYFNILSTFFGRLPFSLGDVVYILLIILILRSVIRLFRRKSRFKWDTLFKTIGFAAVVYLLFHVSWGINYYKYPMHQQLEIQNDYSTQQLVNFTEELIQNTNEIHSSITSDSLAVEFEKPVSHYKTLVFQEFKNLSFTSNTLEQQNIKASLISLPLSYMGFGGYLNPFTLEAQYNAKVPGYKYPTLIAHEMGHQLGFAKENEANFIACVVNMNSNERQLKYAGFSYALRFCLNEVYRRSPDEFERLKKSINPGILKNFTQIQNFWSSYENPLEPLFKSFYGNFLKVNNQPEGIRSYSYVVALLVNYYSQNSLPSSN